MKSNSKSEDEEKAKQSKGRVDLTHGGELVEAISPDDLISVHDSSCKHKTLVRDPSETEFNAFICANPDCGEVMLYDKSN
jgi:hypothetical protein